MLLQPLRSPALVPTQARTNFADRLRALRSAAGLTQQRLGVLIGLAEDVASTRINRYEEGVHDCDLATASKIAKILGVPLASLYAERESVAKAIAALSAMTDAEVEAFVSRLPKGQK